MNPYLDIKKIGLALLTLAVCTALLFAFYMRLQVTAIRKAQHNNNSIRLYGQYRKVYVDPSCPIKAKSSGIYHLPGDSFYNRITADYCFATGEQAAAAGFRASEQ